MEQAISREGRLWFRGLELECYADRGFPMSQGSICDALSCFSQGPFTNAGRYAFCDEHLNQLVSADADPGDCSDALGG